MVVEGSVCVCLDSGNNQKINIISEINILLYTLFRLHVIYFLSPCYICSPSCWTPRRGPEGSYEFRIVRACVSPWVEVGFRLRELFLVIRVAPLVFYDILNVVRGQ